MTTTHVSTTDPTNIASMEATLASSTKSCPESSFGLNSAHGFVSSGATWLTSCPIPDAGFSKTGMVPPTRSVCEGDADGQRLLKDESTCRSCGQ